MHDKQGSEIDFALSNGKELTHLIECKLIDDQPHRAFAKFALQWPKAQSIQLVRHLRGNELCKGIAITQAAPWLADLAA